MRKPKVNSNLYNAKVQWGSLITVEKRAVVSDTDDQFGYRFKGAGRVSNVVAYLQGAVYMQMNT